MTECCCTYVCYVLGKDTYNLLKQAVYIQCGGPFWQNTLKNKSKNEYFVMVWLDDADSIT